MKRSLWLQFLHETRSDTAVEFAIIGSVLFLFLFGIFLVGIVQFWQVVLDDAVRNAARQVAIGAASTTAGVHNGVDFVTSVCGEFGNAASHCSATLQYSVQGGNTFSAIIPAKINAAGTLSNTATFANVTVLNPVLVQVAYKLPFNLPLISSNLLSLNGTQSLISAVATAGEP